MGAVMTTVPTVASSHRFTGPIALTFDPVADEILEADRIYAESLARYGHHFAALVSHLNHYRGKRLRPAILLLVAKACGRITPQHHTLAAAVEMIHTATLVHDDVLDEAELRRNVATVNTAWGNKISILLGDMLFSNAFHLTSTVDARACAIIGEATNRVCAGELRQVSERGNLNLTESDYFAIIDGKTAALTECCAYLGAIYAGIPEPLATRLANYGRQLGLAFQIADDVLDLIGEEATAGKTLGTDLEQQKLTLPVIHCLHQLPRAKADILRTAIRECDPEVHSRIQATVLATHSIEYARRTAVHLARSAQAELECLPWSECRALLETITDWAVHRAK